jgi:hypothetical protein
VSCIECWVLTPIIREAIEISKYLNFNHEDICRLSKAWLHLFSLKPLTLPGGPKGWSSTTSSPNPVVLNNLHLFTHNCWKLFPGHQNLFHHHKFKKNPSPPFLTHMLLSPWNVACFSTPPTSTIKSTLPLAACPVQGF